MTINNMIISFIASVSIMILPMWSTIPDTYYQCWAIVASYSHESKKVYVCDWIDDQEFHLNHELWHYYWFNIMTEIQRKRYTKEYNKAKVFYREYSNTNAEEDFADNFSLMILERRQAYGIQKRINLIKHFYKK